MEIEFEIKEHMSILSEKNNGWTKEINIVSWGGKTPKFDIREWSPEHDKMGKGVTLSENELWVLFNSLKEYFGEEINSYNRCESKDFKEIKDIFFDK